MRFFAHGLTRLTGRVIYSVFTAFKPPAVSNQSMNVGRLWPSCNIVRVIIARRATLFHYKRAVRNKGRHFTDMVYFYFTWNPSMTKTFTDNFPKLRVITELKIKTQTMLLSSTRPPGGGGAMFAGYLPLAPQSPYPIMVYFLANYRPHLSHFLENVIFAIPT